MSHTPLLCSSQVSCITGQQRCGGTSGGPPEPSAEHLLKGNLMYIRKIAAAAGFACGAAGLHHSPQPICQTMRQEVPPTARSTDCLLQRSPHTHHLDISFDGYTLYDGGGTAVANTGAAGNGFYDFAIAYGAGATPPPRVATATTPWLRVPTLSPTPAP